MVFRRQFAKINDIDFFFIFFLTILTVKEKIVRKSTGLRMGHVCFKFLKNKLVNCMYFYEMNTSADPLQNKA